MKTNQIIKNGIKVVGDFGIGYTLGQFAGAIPTVTPIGKVAVLTGAVMLDWVLIDAVNEKLDEVWDDWMEILDYLSEDETVVVK